MRGAHQRGGHEGHRHGRHQVPVERPGQVFLEQPLHDVGGVGADHHQLAVGHVDHAHQAVGDGQAQRHQQEDGAQTDAGEQGTQFVTPDQGAFDGLQRGQQLALHVRFGFRLEAFVQQQFGLRRLAGGQRLGGFQAAGLVAAAQQRGGAGQLQLRADAVVLFCGQRLVQQGQAGFVGLLQQRLDTLKAQLVVGTEQLERRQRVVDFTAHAVVADHVFGVVGQGGGLTGHRVRRLAVANDEDLLAGNFHRIVSQRLDEGGRAFIAGGDGFRQRFDARIGFTGGDGRGLGGGQGLRGPGPQPQTRQKSGKPEP
jgi:hypothetical protein